VAQPRMHAEKLQKQQVGAKKKDLTSVLGGLVWQKHPGKLIITDTAKLYWKLPCGLHLRFMSIQAANKQLQNPKHPGSLAECERCSVGNYRLHPEPVVDHVHRSFFEQMAWLAVEHALSKPDVMQHIHENSGSPTNMMVGADLGYVVECKVVKGWHGTVDIFAPGLNLIIQVDGQHHDASEQQDKDVAFMCMATKQHYNVLRIHHGDIKHVYADVDNVVHACMLQAAGGIVVRCSGSHVLLQHNRYTELVHSLNKSV
jgi:hypothetical protein